MRVELKRESYEKKSQSYVYGSGYKPLESYQAEMTPEEFAFKYAKALQDNPSLNTDDQGRYVGDDAVFAVILGQDPEPFKKTYQRRNEDDVISHEPLCVGMKVVCDGKLAQVTIGPNASNTHYFFRITESGLKPLPYGEDCTVSNTDNREKAYTLNFSIERGSPAWPWVALYPEKFAGLIEFTEILNPGDENPLTGLVTAKDAPVRTLAKQIASKLEQARDNWIRDIVSSL